MFWLKNQLTSTFFANIMKSSIYQAVGFPPSVQCSELLVECAKNYDPITWMIQSHKGIVLAYLAEDAIVEVFGVPKSVNMWEKTKDEYEAKFLKKAEVCMIVVNKEWTI